MNFSNIIMLKFHKTVNYSWSVPDMNILARQLLKRISRTDEGNYHS